MKFAVRSRQASALPGVRGTARVDRRTAHLLPRLRRGDVAVLDHVDLDRVTAQALVDSGVVAVVNAGAMISGRYPALGPQVLAEAGIILADRAGPEVFARVRDGSHVRLVDGAVHVGDELVVSARQLDPELVAHEMGEARAGLAAQLESFTRNSTEFLRREQDLLLHGRGVPRTSTRIEGRPVVVVVASHGWEEEMRAVKAFVREQRPVLVGVDRGADALVKSGLRPEIVVAGPDDLPAADVLRKASDVVLLLERGAGRSATEGLERMNIRPLLFETGATSEDAALLLAEAAGASLIVGVGMHATLDEFLDRRRSGLASTFLTRLKVGPRLVDATAIPVLYDGKVRPRHLMAVTLAGLAAVAAAVGVTPVGQEWAADLGPALSATVDNLRGIFS